jgi:hypothetical protein
MPATFLATPAAPWQSAVLMSYTLRSATLADIEILIHHRHAMWRDMGRDPQFLGMVEPTARAYFTAALPNGGYRGWLVEADGKVVGGAGVVLSAWPGILGSTLPQRAMILNMYVEPAYAVAASHAHSWKP